MISVAAQVQNQAADGVCRKAAILENGVPGCVASHSLVLPKRAQEIRKGLDWNFKSLDCSLKSNEDRMRGGSRITSAQFRTPPVQQLHCGRWIWDLIGQIVSPSAVRVDIVEVLPQSTRQKHRCDDEIFVVVVRKPACVPLGLFDGTAGRRQFFSNFQVYG